MKKRILIVGEISQTTKELIEKLLNEGHEVIVGSMNNTVAGVQHMELDLTLLDSVREFLDAFNRRYAYLDAFLFQEHKLPIGSAFTSEGFDPLVVMYYLAPVLLTEGLKISLMTEEHARIIYLISNDAFKGNTQDPGQLFSSSRSYLNSSRMLLMFAVYTSGKLKGDHVTVNMLNKPVEEKNPIKRFMKRMPAHTSEDLYYLMMSDDLRYKTSKLFNGKQIMVIPQDKIKKSEINLLISQTKKTLRLQ